jgi:SAM-dependent methyltransferase
MNGNRLAIAHPGSAWLAGAARVRIRPLTKGILSFAVPKLATVHGYSNPLGTISAASCYSIFLRHISLLASVGIQKVPKIVAELGPGSSLGTGYAALLAGAGKYYALDLIDFSDTALNLSVFDEIVEMFRQKKPIPSSGLHSLRFPDLDHYGFPEFLAFEPNAAFEKRAAEIREDIALKTGVFVQVAAPWTQLSILSPQSVDWIFSQSVLEYIDDLPAVYRALRQWLKPSGVTSHLIDFGCHGMTQDWNGHWALSDRVWFALRGRRPYLINRAPYSEHLRLAADTGFVAVLEKRSKRFDGLIAEQFAPLFRDIVDEDARTQMVLAIGRVAA